MQISNGAGGPVSNAGVDTRNRLLTYATTRSEALSRNIDGSSYSVYMDVTPAAGNTLFFLLGTNTSTVPVVVNFIKFPAVDNSDNFKVVVGKYATPSVTNPTGDVAVNKNVGSNKVCPWTVSVGESISLSSALSTLDIMPAANNQYIPTDEIVVQPGYCLGIQTSAGGAQVRGSVHFYTLEGTTTGTWSE
jgi:hypothetical protein